MSVTITDTVEGDVTIVAINGRLTRDDRDGGMRTHFEELFAREKKLIYVDLRGIEHVDQFGLRELDRFFSHRMIVEHGLRFLGLSQQLAMLFGGAGTSGRFVACNGKAATVTAKSLN